MNTLKPSLISSYAPRHICGKSTDDISRVLEPYRGYPFDVGVDLYLFMEPDIRSWLKRSKSRRTSAFQILSKPQEIKQIRNICLQLRDRFQRPIAVTSFMPEIASQHSGADDAVDVAILNLMCFALEICRDESSPVLQLVAGSIIDRVQLDEANQLVAVEEQSQIIYDRILSRIARCYQRLSELGNSNCSKLKLAFELEPGCLHVLRSLKTIGDFINTASHHPDEFVREKVGLNLDLAHWYLAEEDDGTKALTPDTLLSPDYEGVRQRIFHSHISGHSNLGHFGDKPLTDIPDCMRQAFTGWLEFLRDHALNFSGFVSLEFEMAPRLAGNADMIRESLEHLHLWLQKINQQR